MGDMFTDAADLSGLVNNVRDLKVGAVVHKAFIEVNEIGSEIAAATGKQQSMSDFNLKN